MELIWIKMSQLDERAADRPAGYREDVLLRAQRRSEDGFFLSLQDIDELRAKWAPGTERPPTRMELVTSFVKATARFVTAGMPVVSEVQFQARLKACQGCDWWDAESVIPRCRKCGCTQLKLWAGSERCPLPGSERRW